MIFSKKSLSVYMSVPSLLVRSIPKNVSETENFTKESCQVYFKCDKNVFRVTKGKANPSPASLILSHYQVSSFLLILMPSQTTATAAKPRYILDFRTTCSVFQNFSSILRCKVKPSYLYSTSKPHDQSCRNPIRQLPHYLLTSK